MDKEDKKEIVGMFEHISEKMATKEDLEKFATKKDILNLESKMETGFQEVRNDIKGLRTDLERVEQTT